MKNDLFFWELLRVGLWKDIYDSNSLSLKKDYPDSDWDEIYRIAEEQSVVGLVVAGIESYKDFYSQGTIGLRQELLLQLIGEVQIIEQRNKAMNQFIAELIDRMRKESIYTLIIKGQGVAQCFDKPLWRSCGDVDLFLSDDNYEKAKKFLIPLASSVESEYKREKHLGMTLGGWVVELHGRLYSGLSSKIEKELDAVFRDTFYNGNVRSWNDCGVQIFIMGIENEVFYVFTHILQHFYKGGIGLRQICDWCRLLWYHRNKIDYKKLESRIRSACLVGEWRAFGTFAVENLGMPKEYMPLYSVDAKWSRKSSMILGFVIESGNFGHNRDTSYYNSHQYIARKLISVSRRIGDLVNHARIFPMDSLRFFPRIMFNGIKSAIRGEG